jgi:hypothetical protein
MVEADNPEAAPRRLSEAQSDHQGGRGHEIRLSGLTAPERLVAPRLSRPPLFAKTFAG